jgi:hypothetical protein
MTMLRFKAEIQIIGINPYVSVSAVRAKKLRTDWRKPMPVLVRVNGEPKKAWKINMMPVGDGSFYLYLHETVRKASKTGVGDKVEVEVEFDCEYKSGPDAMPGWFRSALNKNAKAKKAWSALPPSRQKEIVRYLARLKSPEAQQRNLEKAIAMLEEKKGRWMGRDNVPSLRTK